MIGLVQFGGTDAVMVRKKRETADENIAGARTLGQLLQRRHQVKTDGYKNPYKTKGYVTIQ